MLRLLSFPTERVFEIHLGVPSDAAAAIESIIQSTLGIVDDGSLWPSHGYGGPG